MPTTVSVIIATYNRAPMLEDCLEHLSRQRFRPGDEVIVVDNGSTDSTSSVIAARRATMAVPLVALTETRPGKSHVLAAALAVAHGDVLAFTDDDVRVDESWLEAVRSAMADGRVALMGGPVAPRWERPAPFWLKLGPGYGRLAAPLALVDYGPHAVDLGPRTVLGANMAVRRRVIRQVGGFAPHLGKLRGTLLSGEDHDLCNRVRAAGFRTMYSPSALVRHFVPVGRLRVRYFLGWFFWSGITNAALDNPIPQQTHTRLGVPPYIVKRLVSSVVGALSAAATTRWTTCIDRATEAAFAAGYIAKCWGLAAAAPRPQLKSARHAQPAGEPV